MSGASPSAHPRPLLAVLFFDRLELGFGGVAFLHHPVESLEEVVDAGVRRRGDTLADDLVDLARALPLQQLLRLILAHANHPGPSLLSTHRRGADDPHRTRPSRGQAVISIPMLRAVPATMRSAASTEAAERM